MGNILVKSQQGTPPLTSTYDAANRLVTSIQGSTTTSYTYDLNGNLTLENLAGVTTGFVYDNENRLKKETASDGSVTTMTYQGYDNLRRSKWVQGSSPITYIWDGSDYLGEVQG